MSKLPTRSGLPVRDVSKLPARPGLPLRNPKPANATPATVPVPDPPVARPEEPSGAPEAPAGEGTALEREHLAKLEAIRTIKGLDAAARQRSLDETDSEYWFAICFKNRAQKEEFLRKLGLWDLGDKYLRGSDVAAVLGLTIEAPGIDERPRKAPSSRLVALADGEFDE